MKSPQRAACQRPQIPTITLQSNSSKAMRPTTTTDIIRPLTPTTAATTSHTTNRAAPTRVASPPRECNTLGTAREALATRAKSSTRTKTHETTDRTISIIAALAVPMRLL